ncbi:hypothetical protein I4U23_005982 [Adineta vaga]|nr:hypothetical protein I4U23_005982 [Adineta vaga]
MRDAARMPRFVTAPRPNRIVYQPNASNTSTGTWICCVICIVVSVFVVILAIVGIALGLGLGLGLNSSDSSSGSGSGTDTSAPCSTCGCSSVSISSTLARVINGVAATPKSWPWTVALYRNGGFSCGGSLITYRHVLTAAHCVNDISASVLTVYAGLHKLADKSSGQSRSVSKIWYHPSYTATGFDYDVAVLTLASDFTGTGSVSLACLPPANNSIPTNGEKGMLVGWGKTSATTPVTEQSTLQQVVLQIQNTSSSCDVRSDIAHKFCAGFGETGSCNGDSGGPIMTNVNNAWTVTGIVSYGPVDCDGSSVFTRVSYYRSLIDAQL